MLDAIKTDTRCTCGAPSDGKWADIHSPSCPAVLKPCPFCGGNAEIDMQRAYRELANGRIGSQVAIYCLSCDVDMASDPSESFAGDIDAARDQMVENWNTRATA